MATVKRAGSDPRPMTLGFFHPSHWDGRGLSPFVLHGLFAFFALLALGFLVYGLV